MLRSEVESLTARCMEYKTQVSSDRHLIERVGRKRELLIADRDGAIERLRASSACLVEMTAALETERAAQQRRIDQAFESGSRLADRAAARLAELEAALEHDA